MFKNDTLARPSLFPLADRSMLLLSVLMHNDGGLCDDRAIGTAGAVGAAGTVGAVGLGRVPPPCNRFRDALDTAENDRYRLGQQAADASRPPGAVSADDARCSRGIALPFEKLFRTLGSALQEEGPGSLIMYSLIHGNAMFREFVLARDDLDDLMMPLVEKLCVCWSNEIRLGG